MQSIVIALTLINNYKLFASLRSLFEKIMKNTSSIFNKIKIFSAIILFLFLIINTQASSKINKQKNRLIQEFNNAYQKKIKPNGKTITFNLEAKTTEIELVKGVKNTLWSYNDSIPGPQLIVNLGDTIKINFKNNLPQPTTIHFHGIRVPNKMDGIPNITQKPIKSGETFIYQFTPKDAGTFWFHPHVRSNEQIERGLYGTIVVKEKKKLPYNQDIIWVIDDWRITNHGKLDENFNNHHDYMHDGRWGNLLKINGKPKETIKVAPGERIRLRLVNVSNARIYTPKFGDLEAYIIAVDGQLVKTPFKAGDFDLAPGNRIDVDIKIPQNFQDTKIISDNFTKHQATLGMITKRKNAKPIIASQFDYPSNPKIPSWENAINMPNDEILNLNRRMRMMMMSNNQHMWTINNQDLQLNLQHDNFYKLKFVNNSKQFHPMHIHGQFFKVLTRNNKPVNEDYFQDTVLVYPKETLEIGLIPMDKGKWLNHCHILEHAEAGMTSVIQVF